MKCRICNREFKALTNTHLRRHFTTPEEYEEMFNEKTVPDGWCAGENNGFYGKTHIDGISKVKSSEYKNSARERRIGKTFDDLYPTEQRKEIFKKMSDSSAGANNRMFGVKKTDAQKIAQSERMIGRFAGEKHPMWRGGLSLSLYPSEFNTMLREKVRKRDELKCFICGKSQRDCSRKLDVHHIDYSKENNNKTNLCSLCQSCHIKTNAHRDFWNKVLSFAMLLVYGNQQPSLDGNIFEGSETTVRSLTYNDEGDNNRKSALHPLDIRMMI